MIDGVTFVLIIILLACICVGCFLTDCCMKVCDEEMQIEEESDITISTIHKNDDDKV